LSIEDIFRLEQVDVMQRNHSYSYRYSWFLEIRRG